MNTTERPKPVNKPGVSAQPTRSVPMSTFIMTLSLVLVVGFILGTRSESVISAVNRTLGTSFDSGASIDLSLTQEAYRALQDHYNGDLPIDELQDGAAHGLTNGLGDPHTMFFNAEEAAEY
ncbi:hypothetical protein EOL96_08025, partial [Candidatus Saccharibacteria bacterium]|nr:hypothetical protein [Candidatus Saccharibacteria bacterium]